MMEIMTRILIILFVGVVLFGGIYLYTALHSSKKNIQVVTSQPTASPYQEASSSAVEPIDTKQTSNNFSQPSSDEKIKLLEVSINDLRQQIADLRKTSTASATVQPSQQSTVFVPIGSSGSSTSLDWESIPYLEVVIDSADYPNYKSVQLEVSLRVFQGNGKAYAQLLDITNGQPISDSQVSTTTEDYRWVTSNAFSLHSGQNTYRIELKSLTGYEASVQDARLRINF